MSINYTLHNPVARHIASINKDLFEGGATDESGKKYEKVTLWKSDWDKFDIKDGLVVKGDIKETEKNGFRNFTLYPERTNTLNKGGGGVKAAQERKAEMIEKAQDRKNESIAFFNATNSAIHLAIELSKEIPFKTDQDLKSAITQWREWFLSEWRRYESQDLTDKHNAF